MISFNNKNEFFNKTNQNNQTKIDNSISNNIRNPKIINSIYEGKKILDNDRTKNNLYTLKELNKLGIDVNRTQKKFIMGKIYYSIIQNSDNTLFDRMGNNVVLNNDKFRVNFNHKNYQEGYNHYQNYIDNKQPNNYNISKNDSIFLKGVDQVSWNYKGNNEQKNDVYNHVESECNKLNNNQNDTNIQKYSNEDFLNSNSIIYSFQNLNYLNSNSTNGSINNINFDVYYQDKIMIISEDNGVSASNLIELLKSKTLNKNGIVYWNVNETGEWLDINKINIDTFDLEHPNSLTNILWNNKSINYIKYGHNKKDLVNNVFRNIISIMKDKISGDLYNQIIDALDFQNILNNRICDLNDTELYRFNIICDALINKRIIIMDLKKLDLAINNRIRFFKVVDTHLSKSIIIFSSTDTLDAKIFANRIISLKKGQKVLDEYVSNIALINNSLDSYLLNYLIDFEMKDDVGNL